MPRICCAWKIEEVEPLKSSSQKRRPADGAGGVLRCGLAVAAARGWSPVGGGTAVSSWALICFARRGRLARLVSPAPPSESSDLPVSENQEFPAHFGLRHRAAAGITETSRSIAIIISEETGKISLAKEGNINYNISIEELKKMLEI